MWGFRYWCDTIEITRSDSTHRMFMPGRKHLTWLGIPLPLVLLRWFR